ncbi:SAP30-binding protein-like [Cucumis melo var. makuwa]|uniref:SAP30-binding protein-like n=2 Tax=Cucumis melo TaxID=3656 RepID=A0A5A7UPK6_CUCMM|nr:SAP30-binding protein-like [Cucumis melo var. makuwa]
MASKKKQSEGIALLSMYNDEDDEMEDVEDLEEEEEDGELHPQQMQEGGGEEDYAGVRVAEEELVANSDRMIISDSANDSTPPVAGENLTPDKLKYGSSTPQPPHVVVSSSPMVLQTGQLDNSGRRRGTLAIVDYGHDEAAMSPEAEDGEIEESGRVTFGDELLGTNGDFDRTSPGTVTISTSNNLSTPQISESPHSGSMNNGMPESETEKVEETVEEEKKDIDPLDKFLPPPPKEKCSEDLQRKINKFLEYKKAGKSFNAEVRNRKDYRNPDFLLHAVRYQDIDQIGSCFSKEVFDPHGYDKSDYYTEIEADMKREMERKELERKKSPKMEFVSGGTQSGGTVVTAPKINIPFSGVSAITSSGLHSAAPASDAIPRDGRQNKKSKWDKVDGDRRNPVISGGSDAASAHAALLSAANVGSGYMAFAQQRRREAEEKRSSERKLDRRS